MNESCFKSNLWLLVAGVFGSIALTLWSLHIDPVINNDGVHYILTAEYIASGQWQEAFQTFKWPAYSALVYLVQLVTGTEFKTSAHIVTTIGFGLLVFAFLAVTHTLGARGRVLWYALITILIYPGINEFRSFLIRDSLYLACYMFAIWNLLLYATTRRGLPLISALVLLLLASLFRVEAALLVFIFPIIYIYRRVDRGRRGGVLFAYLCLAILALGVFYGWWIYQPDGDQSRWVILSRPFEVLSLAGSQVWIEIQKNVQFVQTNRLNDGSYILSWILMVVTVFWIVIKETAEAITAPFLILLIYAWRHRQVIPTQVPGVRRVFTIILSLQLIVLLTFVSIKFFIASRYPIALSLTLILAVPFTIEHLLHAKGKTAKVWKTFLIRSSVVLLLLVNAVEGLDSFSHKKYLQVAGSWARENIEDNARIISNDPKFLFYANRYRDYRVLIADPGQFATWLNTNLWQWKDYVFVYLTKHDNELREIVEKSLDQEPIKIFAGDRGDELRVYYTADD